MALSFDDLDDQSNFIRNQKPIWTLGLKDPAAEEEVLKWLNTEIRWLQSDQEWRLRTIQKNLALYKGVQYESQDIKDHSRDREQGRSRPVKKIVANHLYDITESLVSRYVKFKPAVAILPTTDDFDDEISAQVTKQWLSHIWYENDFEAQVLPNVVRLAKVAGEGYLFVTWDSELGELHPASPKKAGEKVKLLDENGRPEKDETGNDVVIDKPIKIGDVSYDVELPINVFLS